MQPMLIFGRASGNPDPSMLKTEWLDIPLGEVEQALRMISLTCVCVCLKMGGPQECFPLVSPNINPTKKGGSPHKRQASGNSQKAQKVPWQS